MKKHAQNENKSLKQRLMPSTTKQQNSVGTRSTKQIHRECTPSAKEVVPIKGNFIKTGRENKPAPSGMGKITQDPIILETVKGWKIPFLKQPIQKQLSKAISLNQTTKEQVATEIQTLLEK